jgi:hypothetical protein
VFLQVLGCPVAQLFGWKMTDDSPAPNPHPTHLIIYHLTNRATGHLTIVCGALHSRFGSSDAPLAGCPAVRMGNDRMTTPHLQNQRSIPQHCANHRIIIHRINRAYCHLTIGFRHAMS